MFEVRCDLREQLEPFRSNGWFQVAESRQVAARMRKALNNALSHRFSNDREYDGHRAGRVSAIRFVNHSAKLFDELSENNT